MKSRVLSLLIALCLAACGGRVEVTTTSSDNDIKVPGTGVTMPAHLDTTRVSNQLSKNDIYDAAVEWFVATDGGVDLLSGDGQSVIVTLIPLSKDGYDGMEWQADGHFHFGLDETIHGTEGAYQYYTHDQAKTVAIHEIGHVLGMIHSTYGVMQSCSTCSGLSCVDSEVLALVCSHYKCGPNAHTTCK